MVLINNPFSLFSLFVLSTIAFLGPAETAYAQERLPRILLGEETDDFPAVGIVGSVRFGGFCTGTLISPTHVLTAAHCADVIESRTSGTFELVDQIYGTSDVFIHPDYNPRTLANDIAILQLNEPVLDIEPAEIFRDQPLVGDLLSIVGFGATGTADGGSDGSFGTKRVGMTTIDNVSERLVSWTFDDESESNTAAGDSGGPGYLYIDGEKYVASVTSGGTEPDSILGDFAFNTRVDFFADWIDLTIALSEQPPSGDQPPSAEQPPEESPTDQQTVSEVFWTKPFPFLQLLINFLTALLDALSEAVQQADDSEVQPTADDRPKNLSVNRILKPAPQLGPSALPAGAAEAPGAATNQARPAQAVGRRGNRVRQRPTPTRRYARR